MSTNAGSSSQGPSGVIHRTIEILLAALRDLSARLPLAEVERLAVMINRAMTVQGRSFHTPEHVFTLVDPGNPHLTLAALFHDVVYYQVDRGLDAEIAQVVAPSVRTDGGEASIRTGEAVKDEPVEMCLGVFGFEPGQRLSPYAGMNEYMSALLLAKSFYEAIRPEDLLPAVACIEATIPFRTPDSRGRTASEVLQERLRGVVRGRGLALTEDRIVEIVETSVDFANRDVANFADEDVAHFLDNTWRLLPETNASLRTQGIYSIRSYRTALQNMEAFLQSLDPATVFGRFGGVPTANVYEGITRRAATNVAAAREYLGIKLLTASILEALAAVSGGDAPVALLMGDIGGRSEGSRLEDYLPPAEEAERPVDGTVRDLLAIGRASASTFDLQNSPLSLWIYRKLGADGFHAELAEAKRMCRGEITAVELLGKLPDDLVVPIAQACARMAATRRESLETYLASRRMGAR
jgi:hypothetical protein